MTWGVNSKALSTLSFGFTSVIDAVFRGADVALVMNVANGFWVPILKLRRIPVAMNVDGIEWERAKWGRVAKAVFRAGARMSARFADVLIVDAKAIGDFWQSRFERNSTFIPYGAVEGPPVEAPLDLQSGKYVLIVARFVPENTVHEFFDAVERIAPDYPVVIVGSAGYGGELDARAQDLDRRHRSVRWLGHVADDVLLHSLWQHSGAYFHGHSVGGTNPALVQAMMLGAPTVARDTIYNREVLGEDYPSFVDPDEESIERGLRALMEDEKLRGELTVRLKERARRLYTWSAVASEYERTLRSLLPSDE